MTMRTRVGRTVTAIGFACLMATTARADTAQKAAAEVMFQDARRLFSEGQYAEACNRFARSQQLDPAVGTLLNLGDCYKRMGKTASAWLAYRDAITLARTRADERRAAAEEEVRALEPDLPRVRIEFAGMVPGVSVILNGEPVDPSNFSQPIPVDPGDVTVEASAPAMRPWRLSVAIAAGNSKTVTVPVLEPINPPRHPWATPLEVGGGVALAAGIVFGGIALSRWSSITDACPDKKCPNQKTLTMQQDEANGAKTFAHISTATAAVGIIALGVGLYLDFSPSKRVAVGLDGTNVALRARFP